MKSIKRTTLITAVVVIVFVVAFTAGWLKADAGAPLQEGAEVPESIAEEPLPDFQPTERLPADSAAAFPTDI